MADEDHRPAWERGRRRGGVRGLVSLGLGWNAVTGAADDVDEEAAAVAEEVVQESGEAVQSAGEAVEGAADEAAENLSRD